MSLSKPPRVKVLRWTRRRLLNILSILTAMATAGSNSAVCQSLHILHQDDDIPNLFVIIPLGAGGERNLNIESSFDKQHESAKRMTIFNCHLI